MLHVAEHLFQSAVRSSRWMVYKLDIESAVNRCKPMYRFARCKTGKRHFKANRCSYGREVLLLIFS